MRLYLPLVFAAGLLLTSAAGATSTPLVPILTTQGPAEATYVSNCHLSKGGHHGEDSDIMPHINAVAVRTIPLKRDTSNDTTPAGDVRTIVSLEFTNPRADRGHTTVFGLAVTHEHYAATDTNCTGPIISTHRYGSSMHAPLSTGFEAVRWAVGEASFEGRAVPVHQMLIRPAGSYSKIHRSPDPFITHTPRWVVYIKDSPQGQQLYLESDAPMAIPTAQTVQLNSKVVYTLMPSKTTATLTSLVPAPTLPGSAKATYVSNCHLSKGGHHGATSDIVPHIDKVAGVGFVVMPSHPDPIDTSKDTTPAGDIHTIATLEFQRARAKDGNTADFQLFVKHRHYAATDTHCSGPVLSTHSYGFKPDGRGIIGLEAVIWAVGEASLNGRAVPVHQLLIRPTGLFLKILRTPDPFITHTPRWVVHIEDSPRGRQLYLESDGPKAIPTAQTVQLNSHVVYTLRP